MRKSEEMGLNEFWQYFVQRMMDECGLSGLNRELALNSELVEFSPDFAIIRTKKSILNQDFAKIGLEKSMRRFFKNIKVSVEIGPTKSEPMPVFINAGNSAKELIDKFRP